MNIRLFFIIIVFKAKPSQSNQDNKTQQQWLIFSSFKLKTYIWYKMKINQKSSSFWADLTIRFKIWISLFWRKKTDIDSDIITYLNAHAIQYIYQLFIVLQIKHIFIYIYINSSLIKKNCICLNPRNHDTMHTYMCNRDLPINIAASWCNYVSFKIKF